MCPTIDKIWLEHINSLTPNFFCTEVNNPVPTLRKTLSLHNKDQLVNAVKENGGRLF
jgi:hypothetical protein